MDTIYRQERNKKGKAPTHLTCQHCGYTGANVSIHNRWLGGVGDVGRAYCDNSKECEKRWDEKNAGK